MLKFTKATIYDQGWFDCFEDAFVLTVERDWAVLVHTDEPVLMASAWVGLPATLAWGIGDGVYHGIADCW